MVGIRLRHGLLLNSGWCHRDGAVYSIDCVEVWSACGAITDAVAFPTNPKSTKLLNIAIIFIIKRSVSIPCCTSVTAFMAAVKPQSRRYLRRSSLIALDCDVRASCEQSRAFIGARAALRQSRRRSDRCGGS
ncbi:hypothetical protein [Xanthomonas oryzae pv. oryzae MAFF 311018]|nr:hypothetical protein [Xanthomonas oryzae pv. oryzae MAFF 311018]